MKAVKRKGLSGLCKAQSVCAMLNGQTLEKGGDAFGLSTYH